MREFTSRRIKSIPPSGIRRFFDISSTMKDVISLSVGEPDFITPEPVLKAGIASLTRGDTHYTSNSGIMELREAIAHDLKNRYALSYNPESEILITVGVSEALYLVMQAILDDGDEVIVPEPCFVAYVPEVVMAGGRAITVPTGVQNQFQVTAEEIEQAVTPRTKAILLGYPCNPTGAVISRENLIRIGEVAIKHDLLIITDELYERLVYSGQHVCVPSLPGLRERTILLNGFSKAYAMTGWRIGYAAGPIEVMESLRKVHQFTIMSAPTNAQWAALEALRTGESFVQAMLGEYDRRRKLLVGGLNSLGLDCFEPKGAFYAFPSVTKSGMTEEQFANGLLEEEQVAVVPGSAFGPSGTGYVRMCYATAYEQIERALERMRKFLTRHG
jgi:aminotransferase